MSSKNPVEITRKPLGASNKKPVVIKSSKYRQMIATITGENAIDKEDEREKSFKNYLKKGSEEMEAKWTKSLKLTEEQKHVDRKKKIEEKTEKDKEEYLKIKQKNENLRREKIAKAEELVQKLKPGPKELQSAAMHSETLKARAYQRNISREFDETLKKHREDEVLRMERQSMPWIEEEQRRISNNIQRNNKYKAELLATIVEKSSKKTEKSQQNIAKEKVLQSMRDKDIKIQIEKEQEMLQRKREALRKNALEAMIMVEQRKAREQFQVKLQGELISIYNEGKKKVEDIKKERVAQARQDHVQRNALNVEHLIANQPDTAKEEETRLRKDISTIQLQFTAQEQERVDRSRQQKHARIQEYFRELNAKKERDQLKTEENRMAIVNRLKNEEVNAAFEQTQRETKVKKAQEIRKILAEQMDERKQTEAEEKEYEKKCAAVSFKKEDKFFFDYANNLVADAIEKERPIYPLVKAINKYKKDNEIDLERKLPRHLESHLRIGVRTPENSKIPNSANKSSIAGDPPTRKYELEELKSLNPFVDKNN